MTALKAHPKTGQVYMDAGSLQMYRFDGTPIRKAPGFGQWKTVGEVPCLFDWQADPGRYGPHYATLQIRLKRDSAAWRGGGSFVFIQNYLRDNQSQIVAHIWESIWIDRNTARKNAQVQW